MACRIDLDGLSGEETIEVVRVLSNDAEKLDMNKTVEQDISVSMCSESCEMRNPGPSDKESHQVSETKNSKSEIEERIQPEHIQPKNVEDEDDQVQNLLGIQNAQQPLGDGGPASTETPLLVGKESDVITVACQRNQDDIMKLLNTCRDTLTRCRHTLSQRTACDNDDEGSEGEGQDRASHVTSRDQDDIEANLTRRWQQLIQKTSERCRHSRNLHFGRLRQDPTQERREFETNCKSKSREIESGGTGGRLIKSQVEEDSKHILKEQETGDQFLESDVDRMVSMFISRAEQTSSDKCNKVDNFAHIDSQVERTESTKSNQDEQNSESCNQHLNKNKNKHQPGSLDSLNDFGNELADVLSQKEIGKGAFNERESIVKTRNGTGVESNVSIEAIKNEIDVPKPIVSQSLSSRSAESTTPVVTEPSVESSAEVLSMPTLSTEPSTLSGEISPPASSDASAPIIFPNSPFTRLADIDSSTQSTPTTQQPLVNTKPKNLSAFMMSTTRPVEQKKSSVYCGDDEPKKKTKTTYSKQGHLKSQNHKGGRIPRIAAPKVKYPLRSKKSSPSPGYESSERVKQAKIMRESQSTSLSTKNLHDSATDVIPENNIPQHVRGAARKRSEDNGPVCCLKYMPNLHQSRAACELCFHLASDEEKQQFQSTGYHLRIMKCRGGCSGGCDCAIFPRKPNECPVRLCKKCFFDTHLKLKPKKKKDDDDDFYDFGKH